MFDPQTIIETLGLLGIVSIIFAESGLFFGFFLPGDTLLFTAGLFAALGFFNIWVLVVLSIIAAVLGDNVGYAMGSHFGRRLFEKEHKGFGAIFFNPKHLIEAELFYEKHGAFAIIMARFLPIIRTFAPIAAGIARMDYKKFLLYNIVGGCTWVISIMTLGYFLGKVIPNPDTYILPIVLGIVIISFAPLVWRYIQNKYKKAKSHRNT